MCLVLVMPGSEHVETQLVTKMPLHLKLRVKSWSGLVFTHLSKDQSHHWPSWWWVLGLSPRTISEKVAKPLVAASLNPEKHSCASLRMCSTIPTPELRKHFQAVQFNFWADWTCHFLLRLFQKTPGTLELPLKELLPLKVAELFPARNDGKRKER